MINSEDILFELVKTLTTSERRELKKYLNPISKTKRKTIAGIMFSLLSRMKNYSDEELFKRVNRQRKFFKQAEITSSFSVHKNHLKMEILKFLTNHSDNQIREWHERLEAINILCKRGLAREAMRQISLFKRDVNITRHKYYSIAANYYVGVVLQASGEKDLPGKSMEIALENEKMALELYRTAQVYSLYIRAFNLQLGGSITSDKSTIDAVQDLFRNSTNQIPEEELNDKQKHYYFLAKIINLRTRADYKESYSYSCKLWVLMQKQWQTETRTGHHNQIANANEFLESCIQAKEFSAMPPVINLIKELITKYKADSLQYLPYLKHFEYYYTLMTGSEAELRETLSLFASFYRKNLQQFEVSIRKRLEIDLAYGYYQIGEYSKAIFYLNAFVNLDATTEIGNRVKDFLLLYSLFIYYDQLFISDKEKIELSYFDSKVVQFARRISNKKEDSDFRIEIAFIKCFHSIIKSNADKQKHLAAFIKLKSTIDNLSKEGLLYLKQINNSIVLSEWIEHRMSLIKR